MVKVIGIIVVLAIAALLSFLTCKSKTSDLFKWVGIGIFIAFALTWVIPYGYFQNGTFYDYQMTRLGLTDIPNILYYGVYFGLTTIIYLLVLGGFYGVVSKTNSYQALVKKTAKLVKGKEILVSTILMVLFIGLASIIRAPFALLVFVPFVVSVLLNAKFDKLTTMAVTFGSILVGTLAATYGTDGLYYFNNYLNVTDITIGLTYRAILGVIALALFIGYNIFRIVRLKKKNKKQANDLDVDVYAVEEVKGKTKVWPAIVVFAFLAVIIILGYVDWSKNFGIECFNDFHKWFVDLTVGEDFKIFGNILGSGNVAFGSFELGTMVTILLIVSLVVALMNRIKFNDYAADFADGLGKIIKPALLFALTYVMFMISYMNPVMAAASDWAFGLTKTFNPFITTITAFVTSIFHADLGYTAYIVGSVLSTTYAANFDLVHTLYVATYGLVQVFVPTSGLLLIGLSYLKIDYKSWFKYIWIFAVAMFVVLFAFAAIVTYAL